MSEQGRVLRAARERAGVSQNRMTRLAHYSKSLISAIERGTRTVRPEHVAAYEAALGVRIEATDYPGNGVIAATHVGVGDNMKRRLFLAALPGAALGGTALGLPYPGDLPLTLGTTDVQAIEDMTRRFRELARTYGGHAGIVSDAARRSARFMSVSAAEPVHERLTLALSDLHELAGWCCYDEMYDDHARWHYGQAVEVTSDGDQAASALRFAGVLESVNGEPADALELYRLAEIKRGAHGDPDLGAWLHAVSALDLAIMDRSDRARSELAAAQDGWNPTDPGERADTDYQTALVLDRLGQTDTAERLAAGTNGGGRHRPVGAFASVLRARLHVHNGDSGGLPLARQAISQVSRLRSMRARQRLGPLVTALDARPGSDSRELARWARQVAATTT